MRMKKLVGLSAAMALLVVACGGPTVEAAESPLGNSIAVHGDWTITIYNEDGSLDEHLEFSNSLSSVGADSLVRVLAGTPLITDPWQIWIRRRSTETSGGGLLLHVLSAANGLTVTDQTGGVLRLDGSFEASETFFLGWVQTMIQPNDIWGTFTITDKATDNIEIEQGQTAQVQVDISFTSG